MSEQEVFAKIASLLSERFDIDQDQITMETNFQEDLQADSIDMVEFELELEDDFGEEIPDEEAAKIKTVGQAVTYITENQKQAH
ncbi:Acyl carrier protein [Bombilactobacillus mellis]|uniref:Acyl carrier protein n=1 Tax=Bombilactobacillus mellis TaxID=1218508 RepID=A0A0F4KVE7_9LACO|nr:acyl carrier protein [Bombilactobacillus mellis]MBI0107719.1 acyl carrier protein [Lactobacillus sp. W8086]MBI0109185.1 acyl carrier protein [Lactobacillus sp. W8085]MBI0112430.1 acyl carrier protein [Lactobacillus sp. W8088]MBI0116117.1 acyl carrier protein [Lactobacillus sp. W8087]MBI0119871.1 acyl carrier protein [Lactobacillus sp. W8089]MBI0131836.1 acyl carrier protein [Lactobacillus sp. W8090]